MKVSDVGSIRDAAAARRKRKTEATGDFASHLEEAARTEAPGVVEAAGVSQVGPMLAAQEVPGATEERSRGLLRHYGDDMLGHLDTIRHGLLVGAIPKEKLAALAYRMRQKRVACADPKLKEIIGEIELRAEVEIAKLTREP